MQHAPNRPTPGGPSASRPPLALAIIAELAVMVGAVMVIGGWPIVLWTLASGAAGAFLLVRNGPRDAFALLEFWHASSGGARGLALARADSGDGLLRSLGALALFLPGLLTDALGLALCLPPVRRRILLALGRRGPHRVSRRKEVRNRPPTGEWHSVKATAGRRPSADVDVLPPEVAPPTPFDAAAPVVIEVRPTRRGGGR